MAKTLADLDVAIAGNQSAVTDAKNAVLAGITRVEALIAALRQQIIDGTDVETQVTALDAATAEVTSIKSAIDVVEPGS